MSRPDRIERAAVALCGLVLAAVLASVWVRRLNYPFDLEWMEGGMLSHAWRLTHGLPLYDPPNPDFVPFIYPPGQPALIAALSRVFGLSIALGRAVSIGSTLVAAAAASFAIRRAGGRAHEAFAVGLVFLGTYPHAGAFYDLVRPDALSVAFVAWAVALAPERHRAAPVASGVLLALATLAKHNAGIVGVPLAFGLAARRPRDGAVFAAAWIGASLAWFVPIELATEGRLSTWLFEVPSAHRMLGWRGPVDSVREWGTALPAAFALLGLGTVVRTVRSATNPLLAAIVPVWSGIGLAWAYTYQPPGPEASTVPMAYAVAYFALGAAPIALLLGPAPRWDPDRALRIGVVGTTALAAALMRVHDGGWVNVHTPLFWTASWAFGLALVELRAARPALRPLTTTLLCAQLLWAAAQIHPSLLVPTRRDVATGWRLVAEIRKVPGPVLSPFNPWLPVYAGRPPSLHAMAVWDCNYPGGPFQDDLTSIQRALREQRWAAIVGGTHVLLPDWTAHYERHRTVAEPPAFWPRTGYPARPDAVWLPRDDP